MNLALDGVNKMLHNNLTVMRVKSEKHSAQQIVAILHANGVAEAAIADFMANTDQEDLMGYYWVAQERATNKLNN